MSLGDPSMNDLPDNVMVDILSRLPVKTIIHCKCVCSKWRNIVLDSYFADLQLSRSPAGFMVHHNSRSDKQMPKLFKPGVWKWLEVEDELDQPRLHHDPVMSFDLNFAGSLQNSRIYIDGLVNGLICLQQLSFPKSSDTYICNPITREYMIPPVQEYCSKGNPTVVYCFGVASLTREYKLTRIFLRDIKTYSTSTFQLRVLETEIYTLGTGQWRSLDHVTLVPYLFNRFRGLFLNSHGHWIIHDQDSSKKICAFDFDKETFELFPSPPSEAIEESQLDFHILGILKGCLCRYDNYDSNLTVWVMKEYGIKNSWHKELVIKRSISADHDMPTLEHARVVEGFKDATFLMRSSRNNLFVYCPQRKTIVDTEVYEGCFNGFAYRPSFLRLQSLVNSDNERVHPF